METKAVVRDKSLRDIWAATDKSTIDILKETGEVAQNINSHTEASPPVKQNYSSSWSQTKKTSSNSNSSGKERDVQVLFQRGIRELDDDNVSLHSIWTPTNFDNLKNESKSAYASPLIDLEITENSNPEHTNACAVPENYTKGTYESPLIDLETSESSYPKQRNRNTLSKDYTRETYESPLIDLETSKTSNSVYRNMHTSSKNYNSFENPPIDLDTSKNSKTKHRNVYTSSKHYTCETYESPLIDLETPKDSSPNHGNMYTSPKFYNSRVTETCGYGSERSLDELNEETFGDFSCVPNGPELTLADISEATAACKLNEAKPFQETSKTQRNKPSVFEYSKASKDVLEDDETTTGTKPKTFITKVYKQNSLQQDYSHRDEERSSDRKPPRRKTETRKDLSSNVSHMSSNYGEIRGLSRENLTIRKFRPLQGKFRGNSRNEQRRAATRTRETFHSKISPHEQGEIATCTRETFHTKGNMSYYTTEKITYVRGEKLENTNKTVHQDNIVWRNDICDFSGINAENMKYGPKNEKYFQNNSIPYRHDKGKRLSSFDMETGYDECKLDTENSFRYKNRSDLKRQELNETNCIQRKPFKNENGARCSVSQDFRDFSEDETTAKCNWQTPADISEGFSFAESNNSSQVKTSAYKSNQSQETVDIARNAKRQNVIHFKVYDPRLHRPPKKIIVNQYKENMKFKNNSYDNSQTEKTGIPYTATRDSTNKNLKEHFKFAENLNLNKSGKENKTFVKDVLSDIKLTNNNGTLKIPAILENSNTVVKNDAKKQLKSSIIRDGKEIADLIVGCERALDMFKSFYFEWIELRKQSINLLEQIVMIINQSSRKNDTMKHVIAAINIAAGAANIIPHPGVALGVRVAGFFANIFNRTDSDRKKDVNVKEFEIKEMFQRDIDSSSYVYIYGVQCGSQFEETCNAIGKFHTRLLEGKCQSAIDNDEVLEFMNEISEYNNSNTVVFYKRLKMCYEKLLKSSNSEDSRAFIRVFEDTPNAVSVIDLLTWNFDSDGFDNSIVQNAWDELFLLFQDGNTATVDVIRNKIQSCIYFLKKEHRILSRNVVHLFKETFKAKETF